MTLLQDLFNNLRPVTSAAYNSSAREGATGCLPQTRVAVFEMIDKWIMTSTTFLFWLCGAAGTGKSTIAHSVALKYLSMHLGASFFFSRDQQERRQITFLFQTIAFQLGNAFPALKMEIAKVLAPQIASGPPPGISTGKLTLFETSHKQSCKYLFHLELSTSIAAS